MKQATKPRASTRKVESTRFSAAESLKQPRHDLEVKASGKTTIGPEGEYAKYFQRVHIASFKDLQRMSLVPDGLD